MEDTLEVVWHNIEIFFSFSPSTDGQTEVVNLSLSDLLRCLVGEKQGNWDLVLSIAEFACNNSVNRSTGKSSFEIVHGYSLRTPVDLVPLPLDIRVSQPAEFLLNIFMNCMLSLGERLL